MKFEQAFYTRGKGSLHDRGTELGIFASSNHDPDFLKKCMSVGSEFNTENGGETGEFVLYADRFQSFAAVGVSPASNADGGMVNKLCHIFIPYAEEGETKEAGQPENYYLQYPFQRTFEQDSRLPLMELEPCLGPDRFQEVCGRYLSDREKLAEFLYRLFPILFDEENLLLIVIDGERHKREDHGTIARELTWLASQMTPGKGREVKQYRRRLSYGVYTRENIGAVHLVYSSDEGLFRNRFYLDGKRPGEQTIPKLYLRLADCALDSLQAYQEMVCGLWAYRKKESVKRDSLQVMYLNWLLDREETVTETDFSGGAAGFLEYVKKNPEDRELLIRAVPRLEKVNKEDMVDLAKLVILSGTKSGWRMSEAKSRQPETEEPYCEEPYCEEPYCEEPYCEAVCRLLDLLYPLSRKNYTVFLNQLPDDLRARALRKLYCQEASCIHRDLERVAKPEELLGIIELYGALAENRGYLEQIRILAPEVYFDLDREERRRVSRLFQDDLKKPWEEAVRKKLVKNFGDYGAAAFLERETDRLETDFVSVYLMEALNCCRAMEDEKNQRLLFQHTDRLIKLYGACFTDEEREDYDRQKEAWEDECLLRRMRAMPLKKLVAESASFEKFPKEWCQSVADCLERKEPLTEETVNELIAAKEIWEKLDDEAQQRSFKTAVLQACSGYRMELQCILAFGRPVWAIVKPHQINLSIEQYKVIYELLKDEKKDKAFQEDQKLFPDQKLAFICFQLWRQFYEEEPCRLASSDELFLFTEYSREELLAFFGALQTGMKERGTRIDRMNYMRLELKKEARIKTSMNISPAGRCEAYGRLKQENPVFFKRLAEDYTGCEEEETVRDRLKEISLYDRMTAPLDGMSLEQQDELVRGAERQFGVEVKEVAVLKKRYCENLDSHNRILEADLEREKRRQSELESKCAEMESATRALESKYTDLESKYAELEKKNHNLNLKRDDLEAKNQLLTQQIEQLSDSLNRKLRLCNQGTPPGMSNDLQNIALESWKGDGINPAVKGSGEVLAAEETERAVVPFRSDEKKRREINERLISEADY